MNRFRSFAVAVTAASLLAGCSNGTGGEQTLVDRATLTVQEMMSQNISQDPKSLLRRARAVLICPRVFKAGFFVGGEGGSCVLLARSGNGTWSYPTFYDIGSGSLGFQFGIQDSQLMLLVMTSRGLSAVMDSQVRLGGNLSVAVATVGAGVQGSTTTAIGADIVAFALARGLFGGVSLEGGVMSARTDANQAYYGQPYAARQVVVQMQGINPGADPLRDVLTRFGNANAGFSAPPPAGRGGTGGNDYSPPGQPPQTDDPSDPSPPPRSQAPPPPRTRPTYQTPAVPPGYARPAEPSGYQPPPGQYTYPPSSDRGPIQEQSLPPPER